MEPESTYEYMLKTENKDGVESNGSFITVTTAAEPAPEMGGVVGNENAHLSWR